MKEIWKPIKDYEGLYEVSNFGNVRSLDHKRANRYSYYIQKGKLLKAGLNKKTGYLTVVLSKEGKYSTRRIHRLVAEAFMTDRSDFKSMPYEDRDMVNLDELEVNHKNEFEKWNNKVDNLEWCTTKYNANYGTKSKRISEKMSIFKSKMKV